MANEYVRTKSTKAIQLANDPKQLEKNRIDIQTLDGGTINQSLVKNSSVDKDATWKKGLNYGGDIPGSVDLNTYTTTGLYHQNSTSQAVSGSNYPQDIAGMLEVISDGSMIYQKFTVYASPNNVWVRVSYTGTWSSWTKQTSWDGSDKIVSTSDPNNSLGNNGDFWFKY